MKRLIALDVEVYKNYFLCVCKSQAGRVVAFEMHNNVRDAKKDQQLAAIFKIHTLVTFNGNSYDIPIVSAYLLGYDNKRLKALSDTIIKGNVPRWQINDHFPDLQVKSCDHIDLIGAAPLKASLKTYGCRIHSRKLQDLPIHPDAEITEAQAGLLRAYCENDVDVTLDMYRDLEPQIELRKQMGNTYTMDMRSMSDPQIAEAVIRHYMQEQDIVVEKRTSKVKPFKYRMPEFITFRSDELQAVQELVQAATFKVDDNGYAKLPDELDKAIEFAGAKYKLGIGGLHSQEKKQVVWPTDDQMLGEYDVASMYPSIILGQNLYPEHLGEEFSHVYRDIFNQRIDAKRSGNKTTADTLKIVLNSSYGKFGSKYSFLYSPELLVQTTLTGQLSLLMLIERLVNAGAKVVSANTDGAVVLMDKAAKDYIDSVCDSWSDDTTYQLEWTGYDAMYSRDVNSYVALKDGGVKTKGAYEYGSLRKGYSDEVCIDAVIAHLRDGTPIEQTIDACTDMTRFLTMRGVRGGAEWRGQSLGRVVRWYKSTEGEAIRYVSNGNKVATSDGAVPMMNLDNVLALDIDYDAYYSKARKMLKELGIAGT